MLKLVFAQIIFAKSYEKVIRTKVVRTKVFLPENQFSFINSFLEVESGWYWHAPIPYPR
jgi:hypothetical protein